MHINMRYLVLCFLLFLMLFIISCSSEEGEDDDDDDEDGDGKITPADDEYVVFAWNDLGMHCLNPTYDEAVILPPYNTVWAQVVKRGNPPAIVTEGLTLEYKFAENTYSSGKTDDLGAKFSQFWENAETLFGVTGLVTDTGLNLEDPTVHNGLTGSLAAKDDHFQVNGIPVVPVDDDGTWNPYQDIEITVKKGGDVVASTHAVVPTSDEINCDKCHEAEEGKSAFNDILENHDEEHGTSLLSQKPVLCASCHGSPALGTMEKGAAGIYLSAAIHGAHASRGAQCFDCHPGQQTKCNRSLKHTSEDGNCEECHGSMAEVASSIKDGSRTPWLGEPKCVTCHDGIAEVDTGDALYRNSTGHGGMYCTACHHSPHAMYPAREDIDNYQPVNYQGKAVSIGSCAACHERSRGEGDDEFGEEHGGDNGRKTACNICHTVVPTNTEKWPHSFQWKSR